MDSHLEEFRKLSSEKGLRITPTNPKNRNDLKIEDYRRKQTKKQSQADPALFFENLLVKLMKKLCRSSIRVFKQQILLFNTSQETLINLIETCNKVKKVLSYSPCTISRFSIFFKVFKTLDDIFVMTWILDITLPIGNDLSKSRFVFAF